MRSLLALVAVCLLGSVGCITIESDDADGFNPFADPAGPSQPYPSPPNPYAPPNPCPDGKCPAPNYDAQTLGREINTGGSSLVNFAAMIEPKGETKGDCPTCPKPAPQANQVTRPVRYVGPVRYTGPPQYTGPRIRLNPGEVLLSVGPVRVSSPQSQASNPPRNWQSMPRPESPPVAAAICPDGSCDAPREGAFACQRCGAKTVGDQWHELWADDDTPLTCLCEKCWAIMSPNERAAELGKYAREQSAGAISPVVVEAIREAAKQ